MSEGGGRHRVEDARFVTGRGRYLADIAMDGLLHARFVRSPRAHARIAGIDSRAARAIDGVVAVYTAADLAQADIPPLSTGLNLKRSDGAPAPTAARPILVGDRARYCGDPVAMVVATSDAAALDAVEAVAVAYEALPAITRIAEAGLGGGVWPDAPDDEAFCWSAGDAGAVQDALRSAAHVVTRRLTISRVAVSPMEPRGVIGSIGSDGRLILDSGHQQPYALRDQLARETFRVAADKVRIRVPDIGGSFGLKIGLRPEEAAVLFAARALGRPVRWLGDRSETFLSDDAGRDIEADVSLALDAEGQFLALAIDGCVNAGAYLSGRTIAPLNNMGGVAGVYRLPAIHARMRGILTNTAPTGPYRGAGRPEATFLIEQIIDAAARDTGRDPLALRRANLIPASAMPYRTALTFQYDSGDFIRVLDRAAQLADVAGFNVRREAATRAGLRRGMSIVMLIEAAGGPFSKPHPDLAAISVSAQGRVSVSTGAISTGQGMETILTHMVADRLGVASGQIAIRSGDTDLLAAGRGNGGSSFSGVSGSAVTVAVHALMDEARQRAADRFEVSAKDIEIGGGEARVAGTDLACPLTALAAQAPLAGHGVFQPAAVTFPNGCHICEVEIDPETGTVRVVSYVAVEDLGAVLNARLVDGQLHGGIAQGIGQALGEAICHDETGSLLTGSFQDYAMPRARDLPFFTLATENTPTAVNPLGAKGVGEAGAVGGLAAAFGAVCDALAQDGVRDLSMPATPYAVWSALQRAKARAAG